MGLSKYDDPKRIRRSDSGVVPVVISGNPLIISPDASATALQQLKRVMLSTLNEGEVMEICDDLSINTAELPHSTGRDLTLSVIDWMGRRGRLNELVAAVKLRRPNAQW